MKNRLHGDPSLGIKSSPFDGTLNQRIYSHDFTDGNHYAPTFLFQTKDKNRHTQSTREASFPCRQNQDQLWCLWTLPLITIVFHAAHPKHFVGQALRRAFLCGTDQYTGQNYEHRRAWIRDRLFELVDAFAIDVCAYAVMKT